jgi:hypothetical protein
MRNIEIMLHDGLIGEKANLIAISGLATGNLNSKLQKGAKSYKMADILPTTHEYIVPPLSDAEKQAQAQKDLLAFMMLSPGASQYFEEPEQ